MGLDEGEGFTTGNTNDQVDEVSTSSSPRGVSDFYRDIALANPRTSTDIQAAMARSESIPQELASNAQDQIAIQREINNTPFLHLGQRKALNDDLVGAQQSRQDLLAEQRTIPTTISDLRKPAEEYTGTVASNETVIRAVNPARLETLAQANEPLYGQEAPTRVADLSPEQVAKRKADAEFERTTRDIWYSAHNNPDRWPSDNRTREEKKSDFREEQAKAEAVAIETLTGTLVNEMSKSNEGISELEGFKQEKWNLDPTVVRTFADYAYHSETAGSGIPTEILSEGYVSLERRIFELRKGVPSRESLSEIENLTFFAEKVKAVENKALFTMAMWQMANEVNTAAGEDTVKPEDFLSELRQAKQFIPIQDRMSRRSGADFAAIVDTNSRYDHSLSTDLGVGIYDSEFFEVPMRITEFAGYQNPMDLNIHDIPKIFAYHTALIELNERSAINRGRIGVDMALEIALRNPADKKIPFRMTGLINSMRSGYVKENRYNKVSWEHSILPITSAYCSLMNFSRQSFALQKSFMITNQ